jgi:hypothetical protein
MQVVNFARADRLLVETKAHLEMSKSDLDRTNSVFVVRRRSPKRQTPAMCIGGACFGVAMRRAEVKNLPLPGGRQGQVKAICGWRLSIRQSGVRGGSGRAHAGVGG